MKCFFVERNPCGTNNSECSHLCVLSPSKDFRCLCPAGRQLKADNKTCESGRKCWILFQTIGGRQLAAILANISNKCTTQALDTDTF